MPQSSRTTPPVSGMLSALSVHARAQTRLSEWARRDGMTVDRVALCCGIARGTAWRRLQPGEGLWTLAEYIAAACHQRDHEGSSELMDEMMHDFRGDVRPGHALQVTPAALRFISDATAAAAQVSADLQDGRLDNTKATHQGVQALKASADDLERHLRAQEEGRHV